MDNSQPLSGNSGARQQELPRPTEDLARQFVIMLRAGLPAEQAILYFIDVDDPLVIAKTLKLWLGHRFVGKAQRELEGAAWQDKSLEEMIESGLRQQYACLAYLCYSVNYITASPAEKTKLDDARRALEAKVAGTAGKGDALSEFLADIRSGKVKMAKPSLTASLAH